MCESTTFRFRGIAEITIVTDLVIVTVSRTFAVAVTLSVTVSIAVVVTSPLLLVLVTRTHAPLALRHGSPEPPDNYVSPWPPGNATTYENEKRSLFFFPPFCTLFQFSQNRFLASQGLPQGNERLTLWQ